MDLKTLLREQIERESTYLGGQTVGSEEYNASMERLNVLEDKYAELEKTESEGLRKDKQLEEEKKDRKHRTVNEYVKTASGIVLPVIGLVAITAFERNDSFTTSLRGFVNCFIPRKM